LRDAIVIQAVSPETKGRAFGFHRAADSIGAVAGPLLGVALLGWAQGLHSGDAAGPFRFVLWLSVIPGALAVLAFLTLVQDPQHSINPALKFFSTLRSLPHQFKRYLGAVGIFGAGDFSHSLLILAATQLLTASMGVVHAAQVCFCALCWRQPLPGRKLCGHHAPSGPERFNNDGRSAAARYKSGIRQKELFKKTVSRILTRETIEFHESLFQAQTLLPDRGIASWLTERRPAVWRELGGCQRELTDENAVKILLNALHNPEALPNKAKALYRIINEHIQSHPALIWPMLVRAEGWYQSREIQERNWGGKRPRVC